MQQDIKILGLFIGIYDCSACQFFRKCIKYYLGTQLIGHSIWKYRANMHLHSTIYMVYLVKPIVSENSELICIYMVYLDKTIVSEKYIFTIFVLLYLEIN